MSIYVQPYFCNEAAAHAKLERLVWPIEPVCPNCGTTGRIGSVVGKGARLGLKVCCRCRKQFRATLGTMFEGSHLPLHKWFQACFLVAASGDRISAHQVHLRLHVTNKTALCMVRRLRQALRAGDGDADAAERQSAGDRPQPRWRRRPAAIDTGYAADVIVQDEVPWAEPATGVPPEFLGFVEIARELGCDENETRFEAALAAVAPVRRKRELGAATRTLLRRQA